MLFQMAFQKKLFPDDFLIWNYAQSKELPQALDAENFKPDDMTSAWLMQPSILIRQNDPLPGTFGLHAPLSAALLPKTSP